MEKKSGKVFECEEEETKGEQVLYSASLLKHCVVAPCQLEELRERVVEEIGKFMEHKRVANGGYTQVMPCCLSLN